MLNGDNSGHSGGFQLGADAGATNVGVVRVGHNNALGTGAVTVRGTQLQAGTTGITLPGEIHHSGPGTGGIIQGHGGCLPTIGGAAIVQALELALHWRDHIGGDGVMFVAIK